VQVVDQLKNKGYVTRGWLGVAFQNVDSALAESFGLQRPEGALVAQVVEDSPAAFAGLKSGDILTKYNGQIIKSAEDLPPLVGNTPPNTQVPVELIRDGKPQTLTVKIAELESEIAEKVAEPGKEKVDNRLGLEVRTLTEDEMKRLGVSSGVVVIGLQSEGPADMSGLRRGDVIFNINQQVVKNADEFNAIMNNLPQNQKAVPILMGRRGEGQRYLAIKLK